jgi:hypothetical protein
MIEAYEKIPLLPQRKAAPTPVVVLPRREPLAPKAAATAPIDFTVPALGEKPKRRDTKARWEKLREIYLKDPGRYSLPQLAKKVGMRDHTSVLYALRKMGIYDPETRSESKKRERDRLNKLYLRESLKKKAEQHQKRIERLLAKNGRSRVQSRRKIAAQKRAAMIKAMLLRGHRQCDIARQLNLSVNIVWNVASGRFHKTVPPAVLSDERIAA